MSKLFTFLFALSVIYLTYAIFIKFGWELSLGFSLIFIFINVTFYKFGEYIELQNEVNALIYNQIKDITESVIQSSDRSKIEKNISDLLEVFEKAENKNA